VLGAVADHVQLFARQAGRGGEEERRLDARPRMRPRYGRKYQDELTSVSRNSPLFLDGPSHICHYARLPRFFNKAIHAKLFFFCAQQSQMEWN
jgi:hypothetical protein